MQVTTTEPAPALLTISTLLAMSDREPKLRVPRLEIGLASELPNTQPLVRVAETVNVVVAVAARAELHNISSNNIIGNNTGGKRRLAGIVTSTRIR